MHCKDDDWRLQHVYGLMGDGLELKHKEVQPFLLP